MRLLVTGGMGFIGSHFIHYMLERYPNDEIINLDSLTYAANRANLSEAERLPNYTFIKGDIRDGKLVNEIAAGGIDVIVHFAAESHVDRSIDSPEPFVSTNIVGTYQLLESARKHDISKFIHVSTDEVYGSADDGMMFTETTLLAPNSPYSASKASSDLLVRAYHRTYGLQTIITRCSNNYGPKQFPEKLIPKAIIHALRQEPIPIYGDGLQVRDWLYVTDHCAALAAVMHQGVPGEIYNIGGGCGGLTNVEVVERICDVLGQSSDCMQFVHDRPGHDRHYAIDFSKLNKELGWRPSIDFDEGLARTVRWYMDNESWWRE